MGRSVAGVHSPTMGTDTWLTPPHILAALGEFDFDPCAAPEPRPWPTARRMNARLDGDGLAMEWHGRVWCNPPYGKEAALWLRRMAEHGNGTALVFARTETEMWQRDVWPRAGGILFVGGRLTFCRPDGQPAEFNGGGPSALIAYGQRDCDTLRNSSLPGYYVDLFGR